jgi:hypothetical protein
MHCSVVGTWGYSQNCATPTHPGEGGFSLAPKQSKTFSVPDDWCSGRIWARTRCSSSSGVFKCETGDCGPAIPCQHTGNAPATLAEFTLGGSTKPDYYDMSLVDGYNVGMEIRPVKGQKLPNFTPAKFNCGTARCGTPTRPFKMSLCPKELRTKNNRHCMSICQAVVQKNTQDVAYIKNYNEALVCCSCNCGANCGCNDGKNAACQYGCSPYHPTQPPYDYPWNSVCDAKEWPKSSLKTSYPDVFKKQCPEAYSWQFDDLSSTYQCKQANYVITLY